MDSAPKFLYRFFKDEKFALDFLNHGKFLLRTLKYYASTEDASRRDSSESVSHFKAQHRQRNGDLVDAGDEYWETGPRVYVFCTSSPDVNLERAKKNLGRYIVKIKHPTLFLKAIENTRYPFNVRRFLLREVSYSKGEAREVDVSYCDDDLLSAWQKPIDFKDEHEFRYILETDEYSSSKPDYYPNIEWKDTPQYLEKLWD